MTARCRRQQQAHLLAGAVMVPRGLFPRAAIMYDVDETITGPLALSLPIRILAVANRAFGYGRFSLMTMGTGKSLEEFARLLSAYVATPFCG